QGDLREDPRLSDLINCGVRRTPSAWPQWQGPPREVIREPAESGDMSMRATFICGGTFVPASRFRVHPIEAGLRLKGWETRIIHGYGPLDHRMPSGVARRAYRAVSRLRRAATPPRRRLRGPVMGQRLAWPRSRS